MAGAKTAEQPRLKQRFESELKQQLKDELGLANVMQVPRLVKIVVNMGVGRATQQRTAIARGRGMFKSSSIALAVCAGTMVAIPAAQAADIPEPPPPVVVVQGWYLRGDIGYSNQEVDSLDNALYDTYDSVDTVHKDFDGAPFFGFGVGYRTWQDYTMLAYPKVFVGMITIGVLGFATAAAVELVGRRVTRWLPRAQEGQR